MSLFRSRAGFATLTAALAIGLSAAALADPTDSDLLTNFNLITSGSASTGHDIEGAMLVGGALFSSGTLDKNAVQPGITSFGGINVYGAAAGSNTVSGVTVDVAGSSYTGFNNAAQVNTNYSFPISATAVMAQLANLSTALGNLGTTVGASLGLVQNTPSVTAAPATVNGISNVAVLNITGAQWNLLQNEGGQLSMNLGTTKLLVINVNCNTTACKDTGSTNYNGQGWGSDVLWNFISSSAFTLNFGVEFAGSILATNGTISNSTALDGTVVAASFRGNGELHNEDSLSSPGLVDTFTTTTTGKQTAVPEPSSFALLAAALLGLGCLRRRARG